MKDMLSYLIARDTMHQNQWMAVLEELGGLTEQLPVPNSFPQEMEQQEFSYSFLTFGVEGVAPPAGRWTDGTSVDGKGTFTSRPMRPLGRRP